MDGSVESALHTEINPANSPQSEKKTPGRRRLVQATLFPLKSQEKPQNKNNCNKDDDDEEDKCESNGKRRRKTKRTPSVKNPTGDPEALTGRIKCEKSLLPNDLQINLMERSAEADEQVIVDGILLYSEKKPLCRKLIQSTLFPHKSQENGDKNNNEKGEGKEDEEYSGCHTEGNGKAEGIWQNNCTPPIKSPIDCHEASSGMIESNNFLHSDGLQTDLMERSGNVDERLTENDISLHFENKTPCTGLMDEHVIVNVISPHSEKKTPCIGPTDENVIVNVISPHSDKRTPRSRLIQSTLFPPRPEENNNEINNGEEEKDEEDEEYCGSQSKGKRKRKGNGKTKRTHTKDALSGRIERKNALLTTERKHQQKQQNEQKGANSRDKDDKACLELEPGFCKRSKRQSKKAQTDASPCKNGTPSKPKGSAQTDASSRKNQTPRKPKGPAQTGASPRKNHTPSKLKGPHCRKIMTDNKAKGVEHVSEPTFDLRLEAKIAAEENARLFTGRPTHPFFSSWKPERKTQGPEAAELNIKGQSNICHPIHVFEKPKDNPKPLDWSNWTFCDESSLDSSRCPEDGGSSSFNGFVKPLKLDNIFTTSDPVGVSLLQVQKKYPVNSMDIDVQDQSAEERMKSYYHDHGPANSLWTNKYQPRNSSEACGNGESVSFLNEWLGSWRERYSRNFKNSIRDNTCVIEDSGYSSEERDSDAESMEGRAGLKNVLLVSGPVGSGKSAAIYACAREQGFQVIEVSASDWRHGAHIKQKFGAAMESLGLNKWSSEDPVGLNIPDLSTQPSKSSVGEFGDDIVEVFPETCKDEPVNFEPEPANFGIKDNLITSLRGADRSLILFEDVDTVFDEDRGLIASIQQIAETTKRPIILTSNRKDPVLPQQLDRLEVCFTSPAPEDLLSHLYMVCAAEQTKVQPELLSRFINCCQGDIRKTIMLLQFWCQDKMNKNDRKEQSTCSPLHFDLDAGHHVIPEVMPWGFPCQLSELVEKEITKSLLVNENAFLLDAVEEEDLGSKEMQDALESNVEAKKEVMLSRNCSVVDGNGFSVQFDSLEDFSNSSGSPVAFTGRLARRRLCTVLSSHSDDELCPDYMPTDSTAPSVDLYNGVFLDVLHASHVNTISVEDFLNTHTGQLRQCERQISTQKLFDCSPTETDQHLYETYKSVDISCVPESSFVPETEINGVELLSNEVSCAHAAPQMETMPLSTAKSVVSMPIIDANLHAAIGRSDKKSETILGNTCEVDAISLHREEIGDSQHQNAESLTRGYQVMDECSRAGFSVASTSWENARCIEQASSVPETWRRLRCYHEDLKPYVTSEQRNASQILKLASGLTDVISVADLMFGPCQPLTSDSLDSSMVPLTELDAFCWYDKHLEMASTIAQHGFCLFANESAARGSNFGFRVGVDLSSEILATTTNSTILGKLLTRSSNMSHYSFPKRDSEIRLTSCDISLKREVEAQFNNMMQNVVPSKMYLALRGTAFYEYISSLSQISKSEASRLSENFDKARMRRKGQVACHYLSTGSLSLSQEDVTLLSHGRFGKTHFKGSQDY